MEEIKQRFQRLRQLVMLAIKARLAEAEKEIEAWLN